jgi:Mn-dependent DtxR family transcriptional regulator
MRMIPEDLTKRQAETLRVYKAMTEANGGITPTVRALAEKLGCGHNCAHQFLMQLRKKGYLTMPPITQTRMRLSSKGKKAV